MSGLWLPALVAAVTALILTPIARALAIHQGYLDVPNDRSSHHRPTPKTGGYAILAAILAAVVVSDAWRDSLVALLVAATLALALMAFVDDQRPLSRLLRLYLQLAVALFVAWGIAFTGTASAGPLMTAITALFAVIWLVGVVNAYNFMDGLNGIAGVSAVITGLVLAVLAVRAGELPLAALAVALAAAAAGFLPFNLPSGSIFIGDAGSTVLGIVIGGLVLAVGKTDVALLAAALPLTPFLLDAGITIVRRALRGERFFATPHRTHFYQQLQQLGWSHGAVAGLYGAHTAACGALALAFEGLTVFQRGLALAAIGLAHVALFATIHAARAKPAEQGNR